MRRSMRHVLENEGYTIAEAATSSDALTFLGGTSSCHVVLLQWLLPDYAEVLRAVEQDAAGGPIRRHAFILFTDAPTVWYSFDDQPLLSDYCTDIIMQPFALEVARLLEAIERGEARLSRATEDTGSEQ